MSSIGYVRLLFLTATLISAHVYAQMPSLLSLLPFAAQQEMANRLNIFRKPEWLETTSKGIELRRVGRLEDAAATFKLAYEQLGIQEKNSDPSLKLFGTVRLRLFMVYGDVLNRLDRPDESIPILQQALAIEKEHAHQRAAGPSSMSYPDAIVLDSEISTVVNMTLQGLGKQMVYESNSSSMLDGILADQLPEVELVSLLLADSYSRKGDKQSVLNLFDNQFQAFLRREMNQVRAFGVSMESACLRFALVLSKLGPSAQQEQAFQCALNRNLASQRDIGTQSALSFVQGGYASHRRLYVGAYADQVMRLSATDVVAQRRLVELIADSKGLSARYAQRVRQILTTSKSPELTRLRRQFDELDSSLNGLPVRGDQSMQAWAEWLGTRAALMSQALPQLNKEGLGEFVVDGATLLKLSQQKLGEEALLGFSIYRPVDLKTMTLTAARVLRYSVTANAVEVQDIGTQKEFEGLVYRWRSAVALGGDAAAIPLSPRLLGNLPPTVLATKKWIVDPDGVLSLIPFEALTEASGDAVIANHTVRYVSSIASFAVDNGVAPESSKTALVIADPVFKDNTLAAGTAAITRAVPTASGVLLENMRFASLPHTRMEALSVQASLKRLNVTTDMRLGEQATLDAFQFKTAPRFLHIATHGIYMAPGTDPESRAFIRVAAAIPGMQSALVLTSSAKGALLTGVDLARLPLRGTELVVLSACDTGNGSVDVGEGVVSLRMAVEEAGAKSAVTSLWPVPSESTAQLMRTFYEQIELGKSKSDALREAKIQLMKSSPKPIQWAGFLLSGQP